MLLDEQTTPEQIAILRRMTPERRLTLAEGLYWTARILVDAFYFSHSDWPKGRLFVVGHALLTALFSFLAVSYLGLFVWQVWLRG